jgi:hypothetical protein
MVVGGFVVGGVVGGVVVAAGAQEASTRETTSRQPRINQTVFFLISASSFYFMSIRSEQPVRSHILLVFQS